MRSKTICVLVLLLGGGSFAAPVPSPAAPDPAPAEPSPAARPAPAPARDRGLAWLAKHQAENGSWGKTHPTAVTSFACLAFLASADEPFAGPHAGSLSKGLAFLMSRQKDGLFGNEGHSWIHVQGYATLALAEAYGRILLGETKPDLDTAAMKTAVAKAVTVIAESQSSSGGWWYTRGSPGRHEGSTTVTAVQALVAAANFGIEIDRKVLRRGFEYLKQCQNKDGGFDYTLGPGEVSMKEGTAADVATLGLMRKFDYPVMMDGYRFLLKIGPGAISAERFPYYGHLYGLMGMRLVGQEFRSFAADIRGYVDGALRDILSWQAKDGSWPVKGWIVGKEDAPYATAYAALLLSVPEGRLSVFNREPPALPASPEK